MIEDCEGCEDCILLGAAIFEAGVRSSGSQLGFLFSLVILIAPHIARTPARCVCLLISRPFIVPILLPYFIAPHYACVMLHKYPPFAFGASAATKQVSIVVTVGSVLRLIVLVGGATFMGRAPANHYIGLASSHACLGGVSILVVTGGNLNPLECRRQKYHHHHHQHQGCLS